MKRDLHPKAVPVDTVDEEKHLPWREPIRRTFNSVAQGTQYLLHGCLVVVTRLDSPEPRAQLAPARA
jgi:hypothetical protein